MRGKDRLGALVLAAVMAATVSTPALAQRVKPHAPALAGSAAGADGYSGERAHPSLRPMTDSEIQGVGCLGGGAAAAGAAAAVGAYEVGMFVVGMTIPPAVPAVIGMTLFTTVFSAGCAVGAIAMPTMIYVYENIKGIDTTVEQMVGAE